MRNQGANGRLSAAYLTVLGVYAILQLELIPACRSTQCRACAFGIRSFLLVIKVGNSVRNSYPERWLHGYPAAVLDAERALAWSSNKRQLYMKWLSMQCTVTAAC
jgi:hypothetical protein